MVPPAIPQIGTLRNLPMRASWMRTLRESKCPAATTPDDQIDRRFLLPKRLEM
jgi:hypothetical protein